MNKQRVHRLLDLSEAIYVGI